MDEDSTVETNLNGICNLTIDEMEGYQKRDDEDDDVDSDEWECPDWNTFELFDNFDDEEHL